MILLFVSDVCPTNSQTQNLAFQAQQKELCAINYLSIRVFFSKKVPSISVVDDQALSWRSPVCLKKSYYYPHDMRKVYTKREERSSRGTLGSTQFPVVFPPLFGWWAVADDDESPSWKVTRDTQKPFNLAFESLQFNIPTSLVSNIKIGKCIFFFHILTYLHKMISVPIWM